MGIKDYRISYSEAVQMSFDPSVTEGISVWTPSGIGKGLKDVAFTTFQIL